MEMKVSSRFRSLSHSPTHWINGLHNIPIAGLTILAISDTALVQGASIGSSHTLLWTSGRLGRIASVVTRRPRSIIVECRHCSRIQSLSLRSGSKGH